jgi:hypothetical protein
MPVDPDERAMQPLEMHSRDKESWKRAWRGTVCELRDGDSWIALERAPLPGPVTIISAWNPASRKLPEAVNRMRDHLLSDELTAMGSSLRRARGRSQDGSWSEDSWVVSLPSAAIVRLLLRYGQLAAMTFADGRKGLIWADGSDEQLG